ncbi:MAG: T9SS type A sorting domain-containing protein [Paludibacter sp.]|jgi:pectate lyase|nr:T9SS type A sorting domain-containing protein [Paludibacter sp.]
MKTLILSFSLFLAAAFSVSAQTAPDYCMTAPVGFGRNATGGAGGTVVTVNTVAALRTALQSTAPAVIVVTQDLDFTADGMISVKVNNKTLLGLPGVKLIQNRTVAASSGILGFSSGSSNFIIRNLIFEGPSAWDCDANDLIQNTNCTNLWVDHCEFYDGIDGNFDNTNNADNISISWCKFGYKKPYRYLNMTGDGSGDHRLTNLIGGSGTNAPADGHFSITFQYCYWADGCLDRMPRARNAELHILNCYYNVTTYNNSETDTGNTTSKSTKGINLTGGSRGTTCYIEGVHFKKISTMAVCAAESGTTASMKLVDCIPVSGRTLPADVGTTTVAPTYPYTTLPAAQVEAAVTNACGAGATLNVDLQGNVSSACSTNAVNTSKSENFDYTIEGNYLKINSLDVEKITVFDVQGKKLISAAKNKINISSLAKGVYMLSTETKNKEILSRKIML